ncbi:MAG: carbohydrate-binding protein [Elusimicrobia bacterium]|nr:carbohydrate-binding protein [Elusimicrobiota bacterium]
MGKIIRRYLILVAVMFVVCFVTKGWADFTSGDIYKEFTYPTNSYYPVCGDWINFAAATYCPYPTLANQNPPTSNNVSIPLASDLTDLKKAELYSSIWGGHSWGTGGTTQRETRINGGAFQLLPIPNVPSDYMYYFTEYATQPLDIPNPATSLHVGNNLIEAWCHRSITSFVFPFMYVYSNTIRVYYNSKTHPTGTISVTPGADSQVFTASVPAYTGGIRQVDYIGYYKDFNWEGDGKFLNWHYTYKGGTLLKHIGTATSGTYSVTWDTRWIPDQDLPVQVIARIVGNDGMCYITPAVTLPLNSNTRNYSVKLFSSSNIPQRFSSSNNKVMTCSYTIGTMDKAIAARLILHTWCGAGQDAIPAVREVGINGNVVSTTFGTRTAPAFDTIDITNLSFLQAGTNTFHIKSDTAGHAAEVNWPGPVILVKYNTVGMPTASITSPTTDSTFSAPANITIGATATDSDGTITKVEFFQGTTKLGEDTVSPYSYSWSNVQAGSYVLTVKATDNSGNITTSNPVSISVGGGKPVGGWWNDGWTYRFGVDVQAGAYERKNKPVDVNVNFTTLLTGLSTSGTFDPGSIRVIEVLGDGTVVNASVPFQFDQSSTYNASNNASGTITFIMDNTTIANATRYYHIYFNTGTNLIAPSITPQVTLTDNVTDEGQSSFKIETQQGTYYYQKQGASFSSLVDKNGNDWINYHNIPTTSGDVYRGIPNMIYPEGSFHPGATTGTSVLVNSGPLKTTINSKVTGGWECNWEIYPEYAKMTLVTAGHDYWFLYEGTPGGVLDDTDQCVRSNGTQTPLSAAGTWSGDLTNEWAYFEDNAITRSLFFAHHEDDTQPDSYWPINIASSYLTVFGFGRKSNEAVPYMNASAVPAHFTMGLWDSKTYADMTKVVESAYRDLGVIQREAEQKTVSAEPIKIHPTNPHYFVYKGQPTILIGSNEHYGAVLNLDFDYVTYLNELQSKGLNYARIFSGVYVEPYNNPFSYWDIDDNTLGPANNKLICPFARSVDLNTFKFDLNKWDTAYFTRLKDFVSKASDRGIVIEITFFCPYWASTNVDSYGNPMWARSPFNSTNNINGVGNIASHTNSGTNSVWDINNNNGLTIYMSSMVAKTVQELNDYDNVIFQACIEPDYYSDSHAMAATFDPYMISKIAAAEVSLPKKHLISQNGPPEILRPNASYISRDGLSAQNIGTSYNKDVPLTCDEITYLGRPDVSYRTWGWKNILAGAAGFNMLDLTFTTTLENGTKVLPATTGANPPGNTIGGGGQTLRTQLVILKNFMGSLDFVKMVPNSSIVTGGIPSGSTAYALVEPGKQYAVYIGPTNLGNHDSPISPRTTTRTTTLTLNLQSVAVSYKADWINTLTGVIDKTETFAHTGGNKALISPDFLDDIALRIMDTSISQPPVVTISTIGVINGSTPPAALTIKVDASSSNGIKQVDFYNGASWLGTDTSSPYEFAWNNVAAGTYSITTKATDNNNNTAISTAKIVTIVDNSVSPQQAYPAGVAWLIGAGTTTIQAENYDMVTSGIGEGEAYHDTTADNKGGGVYRTSEYVDVQVCGDTDAGYNIGWTMPGEWLEYSINVNQGGEYKIILRCASGMTSNGGPIHLEFGTHKESAYVKTASVSVPPTGGWGTWTDLTLSTGVTLTAGNQIMKLVMETSAATGCGNFNYIKLIKVTADTPNTVETPTIGPGAGTYPDSVTVTLGCLTSGATIRYTTDGTDPTSTSTQYSAPFTLSASATVRARAFKTTMTDSSINSVAYVITSVSTQQSYGNSGNPWQIIAGTTTIQVENYDTVTTGSASGETYFDTTSDNKGGGVFRTTEGVDVGVCTDIDGGYYVGWTAPTEWLEYSVNVNETGEYKIIIRAANGGSTASPIHIEFGDHNLAPYRTTPSVSVPATGGWATWADVIVSSNVSLTVGNQIMKLVMETGSSAGNGNFNYVRLIRLTADTTPPVVSVVIPTNVSGSGIVITWTTNEPATSMVEYGLTTSYGSVTPVTDTDGVYNHNVTLSGLTENTVYHYRMVSVDMNGNPTTTGDYNFTTISNDPNPPVISNVTAGVTLNSAVITWTTDEDSDSQVAYGTSTALGTITTLDSIATRLHSVPLNGLDKGKTYYYKVYSRDASNNLAISSQYSFKTYNLKHRIYTYYYDDGTTATKTGASAAASLKFKVQVYNIDENNIATDYTGTVTLTTKNSKSSVLDTTNLTLTESDSGEKEVSIPFRSDINTVELTGDVTAPVVISFNEMYIAKLVGYQGGSIRGANGLKILIPTGVLSANKYLASIKTSAAPAVKNNMKYVNTVNPICYDFGELSFGTGNAPVLENQVFTRAVNITIPYTAADIGTLNKDGLRIYYWTGTDWDLVSGVQTVDKVNNTVTATVKHFSTYRILGSYVSVDMSNVKVYPNPYNPETAVSGKLKVINLPMNSTMKLYSVAGRIVRELKEVDFGNLGWLEWDGKNDDGDKVGRGVYIYQLEDAAGSKKTGKIGLVK